MRVITLCVGCVVIIIFLCSFLFSNNRLLPRFPQPFPDPMQLPHLTVHSVESVESSRSYTPTEIPSVALSRTNTPTILPSVVFQLPSEDLWFERNLTHPNWNFIAPSEFYVSSAHSVVSNTNISNKFVVAIASAVRGNQSTTIKNTPLLLSFLRTFLISAQQHHFYKFYFSYDTIDVFYSNQSVRETISKIILSSAGNDIAMRVKPFSSGAISLSVHWLPCPYTGKPAWAQSDAVVSAYREGADYAYRTNDDSLFPARADWVDQFISALRGHTLQNVGVVGPVASSDPSWILTHDFTHRTHAAIFGFHYPRSLPNWSADDWIGSVYDDFHLGLRQALPQIVIHHMRGMFGTRYHPDNSSIRMHALNSAVIAGHRSIHDWVFTTHTRNITAQYIVRKCC